METKRSKSLRGLKSLSKSSTMGGSVPDKPVHWVNVQILDHRFVALFSISRQKNKLIVNNGVYTCTLKGRC